MLITACDRPDDTPDGTGSMEPLGLRATDGAAPGYIEDSGCGLCHAEIYQSYQAVGMANSMARPESARLVEDFEQADYYHGQSGRHYRIEWRGDELWFERFRRGADGEPTDAIEIRVDWVLGSGNRARSYLYQTPAGSLYQLPLGWYSQDGIWAMSPGFERADHAGIERQVRRECVFCHTAYPEMESGSDRHDQPHLFPAGLPQGIGCQRCHGPGADHVRMVQDEQPMEEIHSSIHNPGRGSWPARNALCYQCHLQPAVEISGVRRMDRNDFSFRPGENLHDYMVFMDIEEAGRSATDRFQINHHAYRLEQSLCFEASDGQMGCLTCHDPHAKVAPDARIAHYRDRCLGCHQDLSSKHGETSLAGGTTLDDGRDCVACHMPTRRTQDVIHVSMTDHRIGRGPFDQAALLAPLVPREPDITGIRLMYPDTLDSAAEAHAYQALAALKAGVPAALGQLQLGVAAMGRPHPGWHYELARMLLNQQQYDQALPVLDHLAESGEYPQWRGMRALALLGLGRTREAIELFEIVLAGDDFQPEDYYNMGLALRATGDTGRALVMFETALEQRPIMVPAWFQLGEIARERGELDQARLAYSRALQINPDADRARRALDALDQAPE